MRSIVLQHVCELGTGDSTKTDEFWKSSKGGWEVIFNPKIYVADFGPINRAF